MTKVKAVFVCQECGAKHPKWSGQCSACGAWNGLQEQLQSSHKSSHGWQGYAGEVSTRAEAVLLSAVPHEQATRLPTGLNELDRVLGGGVVPGSVVLLGGDPGIGKSTLLLQTLAKLSAQHSVLYVTGEESLQQVSMRAARMQVNGVHCHLMAATEVEAILGCAQSQNPAIMVVDSIQTVYTSGLSSAPGSVAQVREGTARLVQFAKQHGCVLFLVGHVTKEGMLAGPRVLEHMVDTVLYFESHTGQRWRMIRAVKNRFGAVNELGVFAMTEQGLREVANPSAMFVAQNAAVAPGSLVMVTWEGTRPLMVEIQSLVTQSHAAQPRRVAVGVEQNRMAMLLAVLQRHAGVSTYDQDVFFNVAGGVRVMETGSDLAMLLAAVSSLKNQKISRDWVAFAEVGLAGELRPVQSGQERLQEAAKHGFKKAIVATANAPKQALKGIEVIAVGHISEALAVLFQ